jgi:hypothetical protein
MSFVCLLPVGEEVGSEIPFRLHVPNSVWILVLFAEGEEPNLLQQGELCIFHIVVSLWLEKETCAPGGRSIATRDFILQLVWVCCHPIFK